MIGTEFYCKCGKTKSWIVEGRKTKNPCPKCGRMYFGKYNKNKSTIEAIEINWFTKIKEKIRIFFKKYFAYAYSY